MMTPSENDSPTNSELLALLESTLDVIKGISDHQEVLIENGKTLARQQADQAAIVRILVERSGAQAAAVNGFSAKLDGLTSDIAMVKGGHAVAAMHRNAALIADNLGCQLIEELPQGVIVGFAKVAADNGEPSSEVDRFRHADMVMYGREASGHPCYITVEASFTVNANDVRRAARNASYLQKYTGIQSYAAVAGVEVLPEAQALIDQGDAQLYRIRSGDLQPE